jgi:GTP:adenosylcobinamide-phosphate guanylyltransferase
VTRWGAILLAGSRPQGDPFARAMGVEHKALIAVGGEPMLARPLRALLAIGDIGSVLVLTQDPDDLRACLPADERVELGASQGTIAATLAGLMACRTAQFPMLVTTADHALLNESMITEFISKAAGADLAVGVVEKAPLMARFPQAKRTWLNFRGGSYSGANLFALGSIRALAAIELWRSVEQDRKTGWRVLAALGPALLLGALLRVRTVHQSAAAIGRRLGIAIRVVEMSDALAAIDVDKPEDHALVEAILEGRA